MSRLIILIKSYGILGLIKKGIQSYLGISKQQESIDSLFFYLNNYLIKASDLPPTNDSNLRIMQKCDVELLKILDNICKKYNITYWLDFGTLLGAYRHKGFIPWDDDMDVSMLREDYNKIIPILKSELNNNDFDIKESNGRIGFGYKHTKTGIWCDIFPIDDYKVNEYSELNINILKSKIVKYRSFYDKKKEKLSYNEMQVERLKMINDDETAKSVIIYHGREFNHLHPKAFYKKDDIFPLTKIIFENYEFPAPSNIELYLSKIFGENYMQIPRGGILCHENNLGPLSTWAQNNNVNMQEIFNYLSSLY